MINDNNSLESTQAHQKVLNSYKLALCELQGLQALYKALEIPSEKQKELQRAIDTCLTHYIQLNSIINPENYKIGIYEAYQNQLNTIVKTYNNALSDNIYSHNSGLQLLKKQLANSICKTTPIDFNPGAEDLLNRITNKIPTLIKLIANANEKNYQIKYQEEVKIRQAALEKDHEEAKNIFETQQNKFLKLYNFLDKELIILKNSKLSFTQNTLDKLNLVGSKLATCKQAYDAISDRSVYQEKLHKINHLLKKLDEANNDTRELLGFDTRSKYNVAFKIDKKLAEASRIQYLNYLDGKEIKDTSKTYLANLVNNLNISDKDLDSYKVRILKLLRLSYAYLDLLNKISNFLNQQKNDLAVGASKLLVKSNAEPAIRNLFHAYQRKGDSLYLIDAINSFTKIGSDFLDQAEKILNNYLGNNFPIKEKEELLNLISKEIIDSNNPAFIKKINNYTKKIAVACEQNSENFKGLAKLIEKQEAENTIAKKAKLSVTNILTSLGRKDSRSERNQAIGELATTPLKNDAPQPEFNTKTNQVSGYSIDDPTDFLRQIDYCLSDDFFYENGMGHAIRDQSAETPQNVKIFIKVAELLKSKDDNQQELNDTKRKTTIDALGELNFEDVKTFLTSLAKLTKFFAEKGDQQIMTRYNFIEQTLKENRLKNQSKDTFFLEQPKVHMDVSDGTESQPNLENRPRTNVINFTGRTRLGPFARMTHPVSDEKEEIDQISNDENNDSLKGPGN